MPLDDYIDRGIEPLQYGALPEAMDATNIE